MRRIDQPGFERSTGDRKEKNGDHTDSPRPNSNSNGSEKKPKPKDFAFTEEYHTRNSKDELKLQDFTVRNFVELAGHIGRASKSFSSADEIESADMASPRDDMHAEKKKHKKYTRLWKEFLRRAFVRSMDDDELEDRFGFEASGKAASGHPIPTGNQDALEL